MQRDPAMINHWSEHRVLLANTNQKWLFAQTFEKPPTSC